VKSLTQPVTFDDANGRMLRVGALGLVAAAALWKFSPVHPPLVCPLRATTGIPCPFCGMTRAVVAAVHGDVLGSLRFNPGGVLVLALALYVIVRAGLPRNTVPRWLVVAVFGVLWIYNVGYNPTF
jgi:hypothetical protein